MKSGWTTKKLGDVCELINRGIAPKYIDEGGIQVLNQKCIRDHSVNYELARRNNPELKSVPEERLIRVGDVLVNSTGTGTLGRVAQVREMPNEPTTVDTHVTIVRPKEGKFYLDFFGYALIEIEEEIKNSGAGASGQTELARDVLKNEFTISFPESLEEQQRIVAILDNAFAGIATAIANAEKNLQNARELFESTLQSVFSGKGSEWSKLTLADLLEKNWIVSHLDGNHGGDYPRKDEFTTSGIPYISANCVKNERVDLSLAKYLTPERAGMLRKGISKDGDVLFAHNATVGPVAILRTTEAKVILSTSLTYYRCNPEYILPEYLAHYMRSAEFKSQYMAVMRQSTRNQVPITKQREFYHIIPPISEQKRIIKIMDGLFEYVGQLEEVYSQKLNELAELKQSILQKAFAGELH